MSWATQSILASRDEQQRRAEVRGRPAQRVPDLQFGQGTHLLAAVGRSFGRGQAGPRDCGRGMRVCVCLLGRVGVGY